MRHRRQNGFTLIEIMITVAILAIIASVAFPSYAAYIQRSRVPAALDALAVYATKMELAYQDSGNYGTTTCLATLGTAKEFSLSCSLSNSGQNFVATATGTGTMTGYSYTINQAGTRVTTGHPKGTPASSCWSLKGKVCDT